SARVRRVERRARAAARVRLEQRALDLVAAVPARPALAVLLRVEPRVRARARPGPRVRPLPDDELDVRVRDRRAEVRARDEVGLDGVAGWVELRLPVLDGRRGRALDPGRLVFLETEERRAADHARAAALERRELHAVFTERVRRRRLEARPRRAE